jgi:hypothetical protein
MSKFSERCSTIDNLNAQTKPLTHILHSYDKLYREEAITCFHQRLFISCLVVSSALVGACLKWEHFWRKPEEERKTIQLNEFRQSTLNNLFKEFIDDKEVPLEKLIDVHEDLEESNEDFTKEENINVLRRLKVKRKFSKRINRIRYIQTRNRFSHGDLFHVAIGPQGLLPTTDSEFEDYCIDDNE